MQSSPSNEPRLVAVKRAKMNAFNTRDGVPFYALREIKLLQALNQCYGEHCKTVGMLDCFYIEDDQTVCIVMEHLSGKSLYDMLRPGRQFRVESEDEEEENEQEECKEK